MLSPSLHCIFELGEISWHFVLSYVFHYISNVVEVSPLGIIRRRLGCLSCVFFREVIDDFFVFSCLLSILRSSSNLEIVFRENIRDWSSSIELLWSLIKESFHEIKELVVLFCVDSGVFDDEAPIGLECFSYGFTVLSVITWFSEECLDINDGDREGWAEEASDSLKFEHGL